MNEFSPKEMCQPKACDPQKTVHIPDDNRNHGSDHESEASTLSFSSIREQLEDINIEGGEFASSTGTNIENNEWFDTSEDVNSKPDEDISGQDVYWIDEEYLKDLEVTLTEDEKRLKQDEAQEMKNTANEKFKAALYDEASILYTNALKICPISFEKDRSVLYSNRAAARSKLDQLDKDALKSIIKDCDKAIEYDPSYLKALLRRGNLNQQIDNLDEALRDFERVLELDPGNSEARREVMVLPQKIEERNERLKAEMMGKLKDLGNMILKPFGLSTNNFELKQDANTGGYNINFNQNSN